MLSLVSNANDVWNNKCYRHMDNHLRPNIATHYTYLICYLHRHIIILQYFEHLDYDHNEHNIYHFLGLML